MLQDYVEKAFAKDRCAIGRFWGQTYIWIPATLAAKVDDSKLSDLVKEFITPEKFEEIITQNRLIYRDGEQGWAQLHLPCVMNMDVINNKQKYQGLPIRKIHPDYHLPNRLIKKLVELAK